MSPTCENPVVHPLAATKTLQLTLYKTQIRSNLLWSRLEDEKKVSKKQKVENDKKN